MTINSQDKSVEDYRPGQFEEDEYNEEDGYATASEEQEQVGGATGRARVPRTTTKWPRDKMVVTEVERGGMPVPLTQKRRFRALAGLIARQKIPLDLPEIKKLSDEQKWYLFETYMQKHLEFQEDMKEQAFKLLWKIAAKAWR